MSHRFPPLRPPVAAARGGRQRAPLRSGYRAEPRTRATTDATAADICVLAALLVSLGLALV